jgi:hypothetical protein
VRSTLGLVENHDRLRKSWIACEDEHAGGEDVANEPDVRRLGTSRTTEAAFG